MIGSTPGTRSAPGTPGAAASLNLDEDAEPLNLMVELPRLVRYPLRRGAWLQTLLAAVMIEVAWLSTRYYLLAIVGVLFTAYLLAMLRKIIEESAAGEDRLVDWPDFASWVDDILLPLVRMGTVVLACFGPAWAWHVMRGRHDVVYVALMVIGLIYYPMAALAVTLFDSIKAMAPSVVLPAISKVRDDYAALCILLVILEVVREGIAGWLGGTILGLAVSFAGAYALFLHGHLIGLLYRVGGARLGWFNLLESTPAANPAAPPPRSASHSDTLSPPHLGISSLPTPPANPDSTSPPQDL